MRRSQLVHPMKILSPAILASGRRGWGKKGGGRLSTPPCPLKLNTQVYLWMSASQPTAVLSSAVPPLVREAQVPAGPIPRAPLEGSGEVGERRRESGGLEGSDHEGGGQNKTQIGKQSTDGGRAREQSSGSLEDERPESLLSLQDEGEIQKNLLPLPLGRLTFF